MVTVTIAAIGFFILSPLVKLPRIDGSAGFCLTFELTGPLRYVAKGPE